MALCHVANYSFTHAICRLFHFDFVCAAAFHSMETQGGNIYSFAIGLFNHLQATNKQKVKRRHQAVLTDW